MIKGEGTAGCSTSTSAEAIRVGSRLSSPPDRTTVRFRGELVEVAGAGWHAGRMADLGDLAREVMEHLLAVLRDADPRQVNVAPLQLHRAHGALFAFDRIGVLSEEDARDWAERLKHEMERFTRVVEDELEHPAPVRAAPPPEVDRATFDDVLERQLFMIDRARQAAAAAGQKVHRFNNPARETAMAVLQALVDLDVVSELDERRWVERFERAAATDAQPLRIYSAEALVVADRVEAQPAEPVHRGRRDTPLLHPRPSCSFERLIDVLVVRAPTNTIARLGFIELYSDGFALTWTEPGVEQRLRQPTRFPRAEVTDDLDTYYLPCGGGGRSGGGQRATWHRAFAPAIRAEATQLRITINDEGFLLALPVARNPSVNT